VPELNYEYLGDLNYDKVNYMSAQLIFHNKIIFTLTKFIVILIEKLNSYPTKEELELLFPIAHL
jgi:hypothetical protein